MAETENERVVSVQGAAASYRQQITAGHHELGADEPIDNGGTDTGPSPYDLLLSALGACTSITVSMYARRKGWPLDSVSVRLTHAKLSVAGKPGKVDRITRELSLSGVLSREQREKLLEIANKCPVHRTLMSGTQIETTLDDPEDMP
jgi:putative redox protein